jgi:hypothetical protein
MILYNFLCIDVKNKLKKYYFNIFLKKNHLVFLKLH